MKRSQLEKYRSALLDLRPELREEIQHRVDVLPEELIAPGDDWQEPSESFDIESEADRTEKAVLEQIEAALRRIEAGTYGKCVDCGSEISADRLDAVPYTAYCVKCERQHERE